MKWNPLGKKSMREEVKRVLLVALSFGCSATYGGLYDYTGQVTRILIDENNFGGCMAQLTPLLTDTVPTCGDWVSLDCQGNFGAKSDGAIRLSAAQLALVTGNEVYIGVDDGIKFNGTFCRAFRVDNLNTTP